MSDYISSFFSNCWQLLQSPTPFGFSFAAFLLGISTLCLSGRIIHILLSGSFIGGASRSLGGNNSKIRISRERSGDTK